MNKIHNIIFFVVSFFSAVASATVVEFPVEELPSEVVAPVLDSPRAVESNIITFANKNELQFDFSIELDEAFYTPYLFGVRYNRNLSEKYFFGVSAAMKMQGTSNNAASLSSVQAENVDFNRGPQLTNRFGLAGGYRFIYGKVSFGKETVKPISVFAQGDIGVGTYASKMHPYMMGSINNELFLSPSDAVSLSVGIGYKHQPNVLSKDLSAKTAAGVPIAEPDKSTFEDVWIVTSELKLGYSRFF